MTKEIVYKYEKIFVDDGCTLKEWKAEMERLIEQYGEYARLDFESDDHISNYIQYERLETDEEYSDRLKKEEEQRKKKLQEEAKEEAKARKLYEQLKKRFGD